MTNKEKLRLLIGDKNKIVVSEQFGVGDSYTDYFILTMTPIRATTELLTKNGTALTRTTDYAIDNDTGMLTLVTTPNEGDLLVAQKYLYNAFSDTELDSILSDLGNNVNLAAAHCCRALAANAAKFFIYHSGDERVDRTKEAERFMALAEQFELQSRRATSGDVAFGVMSSGVYDDNDDDAMLNG